MSNGLGDVEEVIEGAPLPPGKMIEFIENTMITLEDRIIALRALRDELVEKQRREKDPQ